MKNGKIFLALVSAAVAAIACQPKPRALGSSSGAEKRMRVEANEAEHIYREWGCGTCHGEHATGGPQGPSLLGLAAHWRRETLLRYLKDPVSIRATDERLEQLSKRYYPISMPAFDGLEEAQIEILADHLLQQQ